MNLSLIRVRCTQVDYSTGSVWLPIVPVRLERGVYFTRPITALVDTGASFTIGPRSLLTLLRVSDEEVAAAPTVPIVGLDGAPERCPVINCGLDIGIVGQRMVLKDSAVVITSRQPPGAGLLLGQHDVLERLEFFQRNQAPHREFVLRDPTQRLRGA